MDSFFGWTMLSRAAVRRAARSLEPEDEGVRDEIGFLSIHDAYAQRFFPGTSVQQTRLRYAMFVPWIYDRLIKRKIANGLDEELQREERRLVLRLRDIEKKGVIGATIAHAPKQPPSLIYWSAFKTWGLLRGGPNGMPSRSRVHWHLERQAEIGSKSDGDADESVQYQPFEIGIPKPPTYWKDLATPLGFKLEITERDYLRSKLHVLMKPGTTKLSLFASLVRAGVAPASLYSNEVRRLADTEDQAALVRANGAAALGAIGRAVYGTLLETICETEDGRADVGRTHRTSLAVKIAMFRARAIELDISDLSMDVALKTYFRTVLEQTQDWLRDSILDVMKLRDCYENAEYLRKHDRARLRYRERRDEWQSSDTKEANELHYRWPWARTFLEDLQ